jgi:hypothetical protein
MSTVVPQARAASARPPLQARLAGSSWPTRRALQIALGLVWLLDAALQFQPYMFRNSFVTAIIEPTATGNPAVIARPILWSAHLMAQHLVLYNTAFALIQLAIAAGFFSRRTVRLALAASIIWAVFVWWFGEGLGGVLAGASPLAGAPGAVILYALIAVLVWPTGDDPGTARLAPALRGPLGQEIPRLAWLVLWTSFGWLLLQPANRAPNAISGAFASMTAGQPGWVRFAQNSLASVTAGHGLAVSVLLASACLLAGLAVFTGRLTRPALVLACLLGLLFWVAEGFGGIATGTGTDPNSGPLLILLAACFWPPAHRAATAGSAAAHDPSSRAALS